MDPFCSLSIDSALTSVNRTTPESSLDGILFSEARYRCGRDAKRTSTLDHVYVANIWRYNLPSLLSTDDGCQANIGSARGTFTDNPAAGTEFRKPTEYFLSNLGVPHAGESGNTSQGDPSHSESKRLLNSTPQIRYKAPKLNPPNHHIQTTIGLHDTPFRLPDNLALPNIKLYEAVNVTNVASAYLSLAMPQQDLSRLEYSAGVKTVQRSRYTDTRAGLKELEFFKMLHLVTTAPSNNIRLYHQKGSTTEQSYDMAYIAATAKEVIKYFKSKDIEIRFSGEDSLPPPGIGERNGIIPFGGLIACLMSRYHEFIMNKYKLERLSYLEQLVAQTVSVDIRVQ
ncbi:hypothetical protein CHU98_g2646 [Xylaria longipes]|nr:hypothetical protein CHU98_g2646 [Xylaria longipes]